MVTFDQIIQLAQQQNKNILVVGSPRSGTHAVGSELADRAQARYLGEICVVDDREQPWVDIEQLYDTRYKSVAQLVQLIPKIHLAPVVSTIKKHAVIVNVCRKDKVKQFSSWLYFKNLDYNQDQHWHNHTESDTKIQPHSIQATKQDIVQFMLEQLVDFYFLPDFNLCYEDLIFTQKRFYKNKFSYPIETIFSNLDFVKQSLNNWQYSSDHFSHNDKTHRL
jgi:hypothetical protein